VACHKTGSHGSNLPILKSTLAPSDSCGFVSKNLDYYVIIAYNSGVMKRRELIKKLENNGWWMRDDKGPHTTYTNGKDYESIPRHTEVNERLAKAIIKRRELK